LIGLIPIWCRVWNWYGERLFHATQKGKEDEKTREKAIANVISVTLRSTGKLYTVTIYFDVKPCPGAAFSVLRGSPKGR